MTKPDSAGSTRKTTATLLRFFAWGIPAFAIALPLNYSLVRVFGLTRPLAYALVLIVQVSFNFFACWRFVFDTDRRRGLGRSFVMFFNGIMLFRLADWAVYSVLTTRLDLPFLAVQFFNVGLFGLLKFEFCRRVFEAKSPAPFGYHTGPQT